MAGRGPAPKDGRRRRNAPARGEWVDLAPLAAPVLCPLPERPYEGGRWQPETVALWEAWSNDPVTSQWSPSDVQFAIDTARLYNDDGAPNEIRLRMDGLGLTPKGKRDLRWRVSMVTEVANDDDRGREPTVRRLRAVG